jgi:4-amino-4-deoxy-L-arabinose transferase-like glycosyltransferase
LFLLTLAIHLTYFRSSNGDYYYPDSFTYMTPAQNLAHGLGFVDANRHAETIRTPGYPLFLLPFGRNMVAVLVMQHLFAALLAAIVFLVALRWTDRTTAWIAGLLFALDPPTIHYANKILTENLFALGFFLTFLACMRVRTQRGAALVGLACGVLVLIRPVAILWFVVIAVYFAITQRRRLVALLVVCALVLPIAWAARNRARTGVFTVSSVAGTNLLMFRAAGALAMTDDYEFPDALRDRQNELLDQAEEAIERGEHVRDGEELPHAVRAKYFAAVGRRVLLQHPFAAMLITIHGLEMNLLDSDWDALMIVSTLPSSIIQMTVDAATHIELLLAVAGCIVLWRRERALGLFVALTLVYFIGISAGGESESRFRVPVMPLYAIAAAVGISACAERSEAPPVTPR